MPYTFECGVCHAIYKLDENQITPKGVKITCPRCMNYFILKQGLALDSNAQAASIEYVMEDGEHLVTTQRPFPEPSQFDKDAETQRIPRMPSKSASKPRQRRGRFKSAKIEATAPYPTLKEKKTRSLPYLLISIIIIIALWLLYWRVL